MELPATTPFNPLADSPIVSVTGKASETRDWASLPGDLLISVAGRLTSLADFSSFRRVCSSWRSNVVPSADTLALQSPLVMLHVENREFAMSDEEDEEDKYPNRSSFDVVFLDVMKGRFYKSESSSSSWSFNLLNFSHGYLAKELENGHILLRHFFTNDEIWLPKSYTPFSDDKNLIFSEDPSSPQCLFALYRTCNLTIEFCQQGDSSWKIQNLGHDHLVVDMVYFQGKMYALMVDFRSRYHLAVIEFNPSFTLKLSGAECEFSLRTFLFTSGDELLLCCHDTIFVWDFKCSRWVLKSSLDGRAIFLSPYQVTACINPTQDSWIKPNYIHNYEMDDHALEQRTLAIYPGAGDVSEETFDYLASRGLQSSCLGRPVWIFPSMCFSTKV